MPEISISSCWQFNYFVDLSFSFLGIQVQDLGGLGSYQKIQDLDACRNFVVLRLRLNRETDFTWKQILVISISNVPKRK
jgi:hypothetical protein